MKVFISMSSATPEEKVNTERRLLKNLVKRLGSYEDEFKERAAQLNADIKEDTAAGNTKLVKDNKVRLADAEKTFNRTKKHINDMIAKAKSRLATAEKRKAKKAHK